MTTLERAKKVRNLYNQWLWYSKAELTQRSTLERLGEESEKATYSQNGYSHFKVFGAWLSEEEVKKQKERREKAYQMTLERMKRAEERLERLLNSENDEGK